MQKYRIIITHYFGITSASFLMLEDPLHELFFKFLPFRGTSTLINFLHLVKSKILSMLYNDYPPFPWK